ncbi:hypothetical protein NC653_000059 [Populus alba x Populus x berolinensis]|uniref:Toc75-like POTRA domain-containing protein n=1 Tax=Populus alba x Populus x berolinensis TaxID=444605 RepID=A0AAD6RJD1_9ROSI|nr:hypothetical protein NC653_000059 [Populus alba x Populus x berolinensis]
MSPLYSSASLVIDSGGGDWFGGGSCLGGGGGGGPGGGGGRPARTEVQEEKFWKNLFSVAFERMPMSQLITKIGTRMDYRHTFVVQLNKLSGFKTIQTYQKFYFSSGEDGPLIGIEDSFFEMVSLRPGGVYTKAQFKKELECIATCGMFEKLDMEGKGRQTGMETIGITISFTERNMAFS